MCPLFDSGPPAPPLPEWHKFATSDGNLGLAMIRGEKIAWIWVWSAMAIILVASGVAISLYWSLPAHHLFQLFRLRW
jgi:hypothetical protein